MILDESWSTDDVWSTDGRNALFNRRNLVNRRNDLLLSDEWYSSVYRTILFTDDMSSTTDEW